MIILAPAKVNLFLEVTGKRPDGYHNIESIMQAVSLYDRIVIKPGKGVITLKCSLKSLPADNTNLALKAAIALKNELKIDASADIFLEKNIPLGAGLGGGSSDAAAVLKGLLKLWDKRISEKKLLAIAAKLGADVPFFIKGGTALARGVGERLKALKGVKRARILLVNPGFGISTKSVYENLHFPLTKKQKINRILGLLKAPSSPEVWGKLMFNRLEEAVLGNYPELCRIKAVFEANGCPSLMSGSGATVFGLVSKKKTEEKIRLEFDRSGWKCWTVETVV